MKIVSNSIRTALSNPTTQRKGKIVVNRNGVDTEYQVYNVEYYADCYDEGNVIGNAIATELKFDMNYVSKFDTFKFYDGIYTGNEYEYIDMGTFNVLDQKDDDEFVTSVTAYDNLIKFNKDYVDSIEYPCSLYELLENICLQAEITLNNETIPNGSFEVENNQFMNGENLKTVLKNICGISGTFATIKNDGLTLQLKNETTESIDKSYHEPTVWKRRTYGINQVIIGDSQIDGEYVIMQDDEDIELNGVHKLEIKGNYFAYNQDKRQALLEELYNQVHLFGYMPYEQKGEWLPYLEIGDTITIDETETIVLRMQGKTPNAVESEMSAPAIIDSAIDYVDNTDDINNKLMNTQIIVDKHEGTITSITKTQEEIQNDLRENYYTVEQTNELVQTSSTGLTNTFSEAGGNNIFRNTGLWFKENNGNYEFWDGEATRITEDKAISRIGIMLANGNFVQEQEVANGNYTISFTYKKIAEIIGFSVIINDIQYDLDALEDTLFEQTIEVSSQHINVKFVCDTDDGVEIYDLMVNAGTVKLAYSQNQNETTTDTVNISKGITITSTDTDTTFKANADGIRTLDPSGNVLTNFTDKGMSTKEMTVENQATICRTLIQDINEQTWFTRL